MIVELKSGKKEEEEEQTGTWKNSLLTFLRYTLDDLSVVSFSSMAMVKCNKASGGRSNYKQREVVMNDGVVIIIATEYPSSSSSQSSHALILRHSGAERSSLYS